MNIITLLYYRFFFLKHSDMDSCRIGSIVLIMLTATIVIFINYNPSFVLAMKVKVRVFDVLVPILGKEHHLELNENSTINTLITVIIEKEGLNRDTVYSELFGTEDVAIILNGKNIDLLNGVHTILHDSDEVIFFPPAVGG